MILETGGMDICKTFFLGLGNGISSILRISFLRKVLKVSMSIVATKSCLRLKCVYIGTYAQIFRDYTKWTMQLL